MNKFIAVVLFLTTSGVAFGTECSTLGEQLSTDEPRVKQYITKLRPSERVSGLHLCDGSVLFKGWTFIRKAKGLDKSQHVYLFYDGKGRRAVAWIDPEGTPLPVPPCPKKGSCDQMIEAGSIISWDIYTWPIVRPGEEVVILWYPLSSW